MTIRPSKYSCLPYFLAPRPSVPSTNTGRILPHLPSVCVGNEIDLSASYWHQVATKFDSETPPYASSGAMGRADSPFLQVQRIVGQWHKPSNKSR